nr:MAG TPA: hypothetical protein [Caudoviricetes sp.]
MIIIYIYFYLINIKSKSKKILLKKQESYQNVKNVQIMLY